MEQRPGTSQRTKSFGKRQTLMRQTLVVLFVLLFRGPAYPDELPTAFVHFLQEFNKGSISDPRFLRWFSIYGPLEVRYSENGPVGETVWTRGVETGAWLGFALRDTPDQSVVVSLGGMPPRDELRERQERTWDDAKAAIAGYMARQAVADRFSGAVLISSQDRILFRHAYGKSIAVTTPFSIASVGKVFTAAAVAQLIDSGRVAADDRVSKYLAAFRTGRTDPTVRQLLTHTSGVARVPGWMRASKPQRMSDVVDAIAHATPEFTAGDDVQYSNEAWLLLGAIVEQASGVPYEEYLRRHVFIPARMSSSGLWGIGGRKHVAAPLTMWRPSGEGEEVFIGPPRVSATSFLRYRGTPAGGAISTADDLNRFFEAMWNGKLVSSKTLSVFATEHVVAQSLAPLPPGLPRRPGFGYGFEVDGKTGRVSKSGGALGVSAYVSFLPSTNTRIIVLSNYDSIAPVIGARLEEIACCIRR
jgi:D-alanyl-D-alanine carboxypeptidase